MKPVASSAHVMFEALYLEDDVEGADLKEPFKSLVAAAHTAAGRAANAKRPDLAVEALGPNVSLEPGEVTSRASSSKPLMAERGGFEPPEACTSTVFKTVTFGRSVIAP